MDAWQNFRLSPVSRGWLHADCPRCGGTIAISPSVIQQLVGGTLVCPKCCDRGNREALSMPHALPVPAQ